ncbi:hypothetical protein [Pseudoalteromonas sp. SR41-1]|uniref:hypothetical protein n=1 Tax=Pseudoalteromonas sp. SR41-1 TaxID=2760952 RepID=UPI0015FFD526|nr:hypothetical protein [Pseudoalteromonas sp. SR41-1]MBB1282515.1 hypothetical protein [Pseudoalteromonas sp. SR41-1]
MRLFSTIILIIFSGYSLAHKNTGLEIQSDGALFGLPKAYEPSSFDLKTFTVEVAGKKLSIPECVKHKIGVSKKGDYALDFSASWYHNSTTLPPYIKINVIPTNGKFEYHMLFNLDNLELISAKKTDKWSDIIGFRHSRVPIEFSGDCLKSIKIVSAK